MVVLSQWLSFLMAVVTFALASSTPDADKLESLRPGQRVMQVDFERVRDSLRAKPGVPHIPSAGPPLCAFDEPCVGGCIQDSPSACFTKPVPKDTYEKLCRIVGCSARKGSPLCPVGHCDGNCICREEIWTKLNVLLINDALGELADKAVETGGRDEL